MQFYDKLLLELIHKPKLHGIALKREPENMSEYCKVGVETVFSELCKDLSKIARFLVATYNNTYTSKSSSSANKISLESLKTILESFGTITSHKIPHKAFNTGKTDFKNHMKYIFVYKIFNF